MFIGEICSGRYFTHFLFSFFRWRLLQIAVDERYKLLSEQGRDSVPAAGLLAASVDPPWERDITPNKVPYYIKCVCYLPFLM